MVRRSFLKTITKASILKCYIPYLHDHQGINQTKINVNELCGLKQLILCSETYPLLEQAADAFMVMAKEAEKENLSLLCISGYRSFEYQRKIWNEKYKYYLNNRLTNEDAFNEMIKYSAIPGTSRHHWGTDLDIVDGLGYHLYKPLKEANYTNGGEYQFLKYWLDKHAQDYGFFEVYTNNANRTGFKYEPWHFSYKHLSKTMLQQVLEIDYIQIKQLNKCLGNEFFTKDFFTQYKKDYLMGINPELLP